jgi:hypothetical protein
VRAAPVSYDEGMDEELPRKFADRLFAEKPNWRQYVEPNRDGEFGLGIVVPAPNPRITAGLYIDVGDEITVGMDWFHTHIWGETPDVIERAMTFIQQFIDEELVLLAYFKGDNWIGSQCVGFDDPWPIPAVGERRLTISWAGNLDAELIGR